MGRNKIYTINSDTEIPDDKIVLSHDLIEEFVKSLQNAGRKKVTVRSYHCALNYLYDFLPEDKEITKDSLEEWKISLKNDGDSVSYLNLKISAVNQFVKFCGKTDFQSVKLERVDNAPYPELTRSEYLSLLSFAHKSGHEQDYLLMQAFAVLGLHVRDLPCLSFEACEKGEIELSDERSVLIPSSLREELLAYCNKKGIDAGPVFVTRSHTMINRSNITYHLFRLADEAGLPPEKCSPNALHHLYETTMADFYKKMQPVYIQLYDRMIDADRDVTESDIQSLVGAQLK